VKFMRFLLLILALDSLETSLRLLCLRTQLFFAKTRYQIKDAREIVLHIQVEMVLTERSETPFLIGIKSLLLVLERKEAVLVSRDKSSVTLLTDPAFVGKNQIPDKGAEPIYIPALPQDCDSVSLCTVRILSMK
jgi:hypothetical protein